MPKQIKKRVRKKPTYAEEDVKDKIAILKDTLIKHQKIFLKYGLIIFILITLSSGYYLYNLSLIKKTKSIEYEAYKIYYNEYQKPPLDKKERYQKALDMFKNAYHTKKSPFSLFYIASCYDGLEKYDEAIETLKDFIKMYKKEKDMIPLVYQKLAIIYSKKGDIDKAKHTLDELYSLKDGIFKDYALIEYGKVLEKEGKTEEAQKKYNELIAKFPNSPFIEEAKSRISEKNKG